ncbi:uncharacterized protein MEPE_00054 [Melanopsichium pennsylvanicum]|uniref:Tpr-like protein n=2 Tax=Melanopsichium pennsylvanicum TaxID=63383 RepID=A0AAJ4XFC3_9BASI|nr:tpr-like protein [Melanopsichium pennsylvanicum 4]SNX81349.1 uncharacterized protein MEPE_00054 [Melanopsichium pennsylvanicum]
MLASTSRLTTASVGKVLKTVVGCSLRRAIPAASLGNSLPRSVTNKHFSQGLAASRTYATSTTPNSTSLDPAEEESQRFLEEGTTHLEAGDLSAAKESYRRSLSIKRSSSALFNLGVCLYHDRDLPAAIEAWNESLDLAPDSADAHTNLASAYVLSKPSRPDLAVSHLKTAASITPEDPEIQYNLAAVLEACEQLEDALVAYKRALQGGIQRAEQNIKNCGAKLLAAKFAVKQQEEEDASAKPDSTEGAKGSTS